jgi:signal transduction histidine kinase
MSSRQRETLRVAIVDDEEPLRLALRRIVSRFHVYVEDVGVDVSYEPVGFASGEELLDCVAGGASFDLMLLDLRLPGVSGLDVLTRLREQGQNIVTIMITAYATFETAVQATKLGGYDFLAKPFEPDELRYAVRKATTQLIINREARRLSEEKRQVRFNFISVLAHELKAPLNAVEGYLKILRTDETPERAHMIDRSLIRLDGMRKLIFDLLDLTRIESGQKQRHIGSVDVRSVAQTAVDLLTPEASGRGVSMTVHPAEPVMLQADPDELEIIINNLVSNAVKYNRDGGSVTVDVARLAQGVRISVTDTGVGLTQEECAKLFQEFVRIKNEDTIKIMGSGLGLSTVRKLAELYGGEATVKSRKGEGSTFTVTLQDAALPESVVVPAACTGTDLGAA